MVCALHSKTNLESPSKPRFPNRTSDGTASAVLADNSAMTVAFIMCTMQSRGFGKANITMGTIFEVFFE